MSALPTKADMRRQLGMSAKCHFRTHAPQQTALIRSPRRRARAAIPARAIWVTPRPSRQRGRRPTPSRRLPDNACAVYRASQRPYLALFERVWGAQAFAAQWPSGVEQVCNQPGPPPANGPMPVHLTELDRGRAAATFDQMAQSIASYEVTATERNLQNVLVSFIQTLTDGFMQR
jgi:hypothetical protein